jgi:hypothetical protein
MFSNLLIVLVQDENPKEMSFDGFRVYVSQQKNVFESTKKSGAHLGGAINMEWLNVFELTCFCD